MPKEEKVLNKITVSDTPHVRNPRGTKGIMIDVCIALIPAFIMGCVFFGWQALTTTLIAVFSAVVTEIVYSLCLKKNIRDIFREFDFTSVVTGLLLALCLPAAIPWYVPFLGSVFAIAVVKMLFGGTGKNIVNPAITGRIFAVIAFQSVMISTFTATLIPAIDANNLVSGATPLVPILNGGATLSNLDLFLGTGVMGCIGETCKPALILGFIYLIIRKVLDPKWPLIYIAVTGLFAVVLEGFDFSYFLPSILSGGLFLGAIFMATDYVTSPSNDKARYVYFIVLGLLTAGLRKAAKIEVVSFAILLMNLLVPIFNTYIRPRHFGAPNFIAVIKAKREAKAEKQRAEKEGGTAA